MSNKQTAINLLQKISDAIKAIPVDDQLDAAVDAIVKCNGKLVTAGMGKAGIIARKAASTFSSTGTPAVFLHPGEAQHGDLGMLSSQDVMLVFSNSGKTREVIELVTLTQQLFQHKLKIIAITSHPDSPLRNMSDVTLGIGEVEEICALGMAPTTSTTAMLALSDVLAVLVMEQNKFTKAEFLKRHHGGYLGEQKQYT